MIQIFSIENSALFSLQAVPTLFHFFHGNICHFFNEKTCPKKLVNARKKNVQGKLAHFQSTSNPCVDLQWINHQFCYTHRVGVSGCDTKEKWYKFNDIIVEEFDMNEDTLEAECFGGTYKANVYDTGMPVEM